jgi:hypothetical protein
LIELVLEENDEKGKFEDMTIMQILKERASFINEKTSAKYCDIMARALSDLGDVYFSAKEEMCNDCEFEKKGCKKLENEVYVRNGENYSITSFWTNWHELFDSKIEFKFELNNFLNNCVLEENLLNNVELALFLYSLSMKFYEKANLYKQSAFQITKILTCFKFCLKHKMYNNEVSPFCTNNLKNITSRAREFLYLANDGLDMFEILKRKEDFDNEAKLQYIQVDSEIIRINVLEKELELYLSKDNNELANENVLKKLYSNYIISPYHINYSVHVRVRQLSLKAKLNRETYKIIRKNDYEWERSKICEAFKDDVNIIEKLDKIPEEIFKIFALLEMLVADSIFCYIKILRLIQTSNDSYIFNHSFFADIYRRLANWVEIYEDIKHSNDDKLKKYTKIDNYLADLLGEDFREQLSSRYYRQKAFLHYQKSKETHSGGRAYFNLLEQMYFIRGDYDDVVSHFEVAVERFVINNTDGYEEHIRELEKMNAKSSLYKGEKYFEGEWSNEHIL